MSTLRERCRIFLAEGPGLTRFAADVADVEALQAFVLAETARKSAPEFEGAAPLVLFFETDAHRDEMIAAFRATHPGGRTIKVNP